MDHSRECELLAYAKVCFERCTSPFETIHLIKKEVIADECVELSEKIAEILYEYLIEEYYWSMKAEGTLENAEKDFQETQEEI